MFALLLLALVGQEPPPKGLPSGKPDYPPGGKPKKVAEPADDSPLVLTTAQVKKKFKGVAKWNQKKGELTLEYDFARKGVLGDWDTGKKKPKIEGHALVLRSGENATHSVNWATVQVSFVVAVKQLKGDFASTTAGATIAGGGQFPNTIYLWTIDRYKPVQTVVPEREQSGMIPVVFLVEDDRVSMTYGTTANMSKPAEKPMGGQVSLHGSEDRLGYGYSKLTLTGTPDPKWAREFFK